MQQRAAKAEAQCPADFAYEEISFASDLPGPLHELKEDPRASLLEGKESRHGLPLPAPASGANEMQLTWGHSA